MAANPAKNSIVHTELITTDVKATQEFMGAVFDWGYEEMPGPDGNPYVMWKVGDKVLGGITPPMGDMPPCTLNYLGVDDIEATQKLVEENGGTVLQPAMDVGDFGRMLIFQVPGGTVMAAWQELANA